MGTNRTSAAARRQVRGLAAAALIALVAVGCGRSGKPSGPGAVAVVYSGWEIWIGNDQDPQVPDGDPSKGPGALQAIQAALDQADLARTARPGAQGVMLSYAETVQLRVPMGPIGQLTAAALGTQADYHDTKVQRLVSGLTRAVDELEKAPAGRRLLIVVSDGADVDHDAAAQQLPGLGQRIAALGIEVASIVYKTELSDGGDLPALLAGPSTRAWSRADITFDLVSALRRFQDPGAGHP